MKVYHPKTGVFDPDDVWEGIYEDDNGNEREIDQDIIYACDKGLLLEMDEKRFQVDEEMKTFVCAACGSNQFHVGRDSWETYVKCAKCEIEECVHEG